MVRWQATHSSFSGTFPVFTVNAARPGYSFSLRENRISGHPGCPQPGNSSPFHEEQVSLEKGQSLYRKFLSVERMILKDCTPNGNFWTRSRRSLPCKNQERNIPGRGNIIYKDSEEGEGFTSARNQHHSKAAVTGVLESKCSAVEEASRSQIRNGFVNHGRETANFHLRKTGQHWRVLNRGVIRSELRFSKACPVCSAENGLMGSE